MPLLLGYTGEWENGAHGRSRTCTGDVLDVVSLLLDYMSMKNGNPGGIRTRSYPIESRMSWPVRRQGHENWRNAEDMLLMPRGGGTISLAPSPGTLVRLAFLDEMVFPEGLAPSTSAFEARRSVG